MAALEVSRLLGHHLNLVSSCGAQGTSIQWEVRFENIPAMQGPDLVRPTGLPVNPVLGCIS